MAGSLKEAAAAAAVVLQCVRRRRREVVADPFCFCFENFFPCMCLLFYCCNCALKFVYVIDLRDGIRFNDDFHRLWFLWPCFLGLFVGYGLFLPLLCAGCVGKKFHER